jgi:hypothetical protein
MYAAPCRVAGSIRARRKRSCSRLLSTVTTRPREQILEWQQHQNFPLCLTADDPDAGNLNRDLRFPEAVYEDVAAYREQRFDAEALWWAFLLGSVASLLALVAFAAVNLALLRLRRTRPEQARPFRVSLTLRGVPVLPTLGLLVVVLLVTRFAPRVYGITGTVLILAFLVHAMPWTGASGFGRARP